MTFYSGGPYNTASFKTPAKCFVIWGGCYRSSTAPDSVYIANALAPDYEFVQGSDENWYLAKKTSKNVAKVIESGTEYESLASAFEEAARLGDATIRLLKNASLEAPFTIQSGKSIRLDLAGCGIATTSGLVVNKGTFEIGDDNGGMETSVVSSSSGWLFENEGQLHIVYGKFVGSILLKSGCLTTHHGDFRQAHFDTDSSVDASSVICLSGGIFTQDVATVLKPDYVMTSGYVGFFPYAIVGPYSITGAQVGYKLSALTETDLSLYKKEIKRTNFFSSGDWYRSAELHSALQPILGQTLCCSVSFDRRVEANTVTAYAGSSKFSPQANPVNVDVEVGTTFEALEVGVRLINEKLGQNYGVPSYKSFLNDPNWEELRIGVADSVENRGTTCSIRMRLAKSDQWVLASRRFVFGAGSNKAMIRPETGAVTFYQTLADAVNAVSAGGTVMLCNDGATGTAIGKVCTIDLNGFSLSAGTTLSAAAGYQMDVSADGRFYTFTVAEVVTPTISASVVAATTGGDGVVVTGAVPTGLTGATYALLKESTTGTFEQVGGAAGMSSPDFTIVETGWYKIAVTANGTTVESPETIGVLKYAAPGAVEDQAEQTTIVAVPWRVTLDGLLRKADFTSATGNDWQAAIKAYNAVGNTYEMWTLTDGTWTPCSIVSAKENGKSVVATSAAASSRELERGGAVWVTRKNAVKPFFLCGICPDEAPAATSLASGWNLVANPLLTPVDLDRAVTGAVAGDQIIVPSARGLGQTNYSFKDGIWGYMKAETVTYTIGGKAVSGVKHTWTPAPKIEPGQGFWFVSGGDDRKIDWTAGK